MIEHETLKRLYNYNPQTGLFSHSNGVLCSITLTDKGYLLIAISRKYYRVHRLAFFYMKGRWPNHQIDHENNDKSDNRWENLRNADNQLNHYNLLKPKNNTSGAKGVRKLKNGGFSARIKHNNKDIHLGTFSTLEEASEAYMDRAKKLANEFAHTGNR